MAQSHIYRRFAWQACHLWYWVAPLGRDLAPGRRAALCVAGVAQPDIHLRFTWQAWHNLTSTVVLRGRRATYGTGWRPWAGIWRRGAAPHFAWQAWHNLTSTFVSRGRRGTNSHLLSFCVAGVALMVLGGALGPDLSPVTPRHFAWQAWHNLTSTFVSRGRRGTISHLPSFCVAGVPLMVLGGALGPGFGAGAPRHFAWQAWHLVTSTFVSRGRRGTNSHLLSFCVAGVPLMVLGGALGPGFGARGAASLCVAGVALGDIHLRFTWQTWHKLTSTIVLRGRRDTHGTVWRAWSGFVARGAAPLCVAGVALGDIHLRFTWQAWHKLTPFHTQLCHPPSFTHHLSHTTLSPTIFDTPSFTHHLCNTPSFTHHLLHPTLSNSIFDTPSFTHRFVTHHFVTPSFTTPSSTHHLSPPHFSHTTLSHTIFDTPSFTQHFATHRLSHTTLSHALFHTGLSPTPSFSTPSFTHHFVTHHLSPHHPSHTTLSHTDHLSPHHLSHTTLSHTIFHTQLCHTLSFTHNFHTRHLLHTAVSHTHTHHLSHSTLSLTTVLTSRSFTASFPLTFFPRPCYNLSCLLLEEVDLWGHPVL